MTSVDHRDDRLAARVAAGSWIVGAGLYLALERAAASAFSPAYSYAHNYISDLGVPACGSTFDGRSICSPLHGLMNAGFAVQGLLFLAGAVAIAQSLSVRVKFALVTFAALNGVGNGLIAIFPENAPQHLTAMLTYHVAGAFLAIVFGNATAVMSASVFEELGLVRVHRWASLALPLVAAVALTMLIAARGSATTGLIPHGVLERISVYTITAWELLSAACLLGRRDAGGSPVDRIGPK